MSDNKSMELRLQKTILSEHTEGLLSRYEFVKYVATVWAEEIPPKAVTSSHVKKNLMKLNKFVDLLAVNIGKAKE